MIGKILEFTAFPKKIKKLYKKIEELEVQLENIKSRIDLDESLLDKIYILKNSYEYQQVYEKENPLVSVCIATYNRCDLLVNRAVKSVLNQTYRNLELIVVGDCCTDDTQRSLLEIRDERLTFVNLPMRGSYPDDPMLRWMVAGTTPVGHALKIVKGDFITHLDDDDEYLDDRIEKLVRYIQENKVDVLWHPFWKQCANDKWELRECNDFKAGQVTTGSVFYHNWFKCIPWSLDAYRYKEPGDWNRFRKFKYLGATTKRFPEPLFRHYAEKSQSGK